MFRINICFVIVKEKTKANLSREKLVPLSQHSLKLNKKKAEINLSF